MVARPLTEALPRKLTIDIWSDVMCPWCLIGHGQLSKALAALEGEIVAEIRWRPFELNPGMPPEGEEQGAHIARKYGRSVEEGQAIRGRMRQLAEQAGVSLDYAGDPEGAPAAMMRNTFLAHRLLAHALEQYGPDTQNRLKLELFSAHFNRREDVSDRAVLLGIAVSAGIDRAAADAALDDEELARRVREEESAAYDMNITGVPAMIVEGKFLIPGAQDPETYANLLRRVVARS